MVKELEQDRRSDVVGKIADDAHGFRDVAQEIGQVDVEEVALDQVKVRKLCAEGGREIAIDFDGEQAFDPGCQRHRERAAAGSDLEERVVGVSVERVDELGDPRRLEEVLAESLASRPCTGSKDPQSSSSGPGVSPRQ